MDFRGMLNRYVNAKEIVDRPVLITFMLGNDVDESETLSDDQLKDKSMIYKVNSSFKFSEISLSRIDLNLEGTDLIRSIQIRKTSVSNKIYSEQSTSKAPKKK